MKRPILVAVIGYIIGIIMGLYFKFSIAFLYVFFIPIIAIYIIKKRLRYKKKFKLFSINRYLRYVKIILNSKVFLVIILSSIISNSIVLYKNNEYNSVYELPVNIELKATVISNKEEKQYKNVYIVKTEVINGNKKIKNIYFYLNVNKNVSLNYADEIIIKGKLKKPSSIRNHGGFDYSLYLKTLNIYGTVDGKNIKVIKQNALNSFQIKLNSFREFVKDNIKSLFSKKIYSIYFSLILADSSNIEDDIRESFTNSSMSHILAVSGMHIAYIIIGVSFCLNKILGKRKGEIATIIVLILYFLLTGFTTSLARACIMGIMSVLAKILHRKNDIWTSISISLLIILICNPYLITNIGLQYSYVATIGIIVFSKKILKLLNKKNNQKSKIKEIIAVSLSAQIVLFPLILFHTNKFGIYFLITNILVSFIIGPIIIASFIFLIISIISIQLAKILSPIINFIIQIILFFSKIGTFPFSKIYLRTPKVFEIVIFYILIFLISFLYKVKKDKKPNASILRIRWIMSYLKYKVRTKKNKLIKITLIISIVITSTVFIAKPRIMQINVIDVGQGDSSLIITPKNKTVLIDGGGSEFGSFDVGKNTLLPYILDKGYTNIDYVMISHFDSDHVERNFVHNARN